MNKDIENLLKMVDKIQNIKNNYKDNEQLSRQLMVARQLVYDCAMQIPFKTAEK